MRNKLAKFAQMVALTLAITLTLSCSGGDDNGGGTSSPSGGGGNTALDGTWRRDDGNYYYQIDLNSNNWVFLEGSAGVSQEVVKGTWSSNTEIAIPSTGTLTLTITHTKNSNGWNDFPPEYSSVKTNTATYNINASGNLLTLSNPALVVDVWSKLQGAYTKGGSGGGSSSSVGGGTACTAADNTNTQYCSNGTMKTYGSTPSIGGRTYKTIEIGSQVWMAENLDYDVPNNDTDVCYDNDPAKCVIYGKLYNWEAAKTVCPAGWHLPSDAEWTVLTNFVGANAGTKLKATSGWDSNGNGTDNFGFSALPSGFGYSGGGFSNVGKRSYWWSSSEGSSYNGLPYMAYNGEDFYWDNGGTKNSFLNSVRCVKY